jgi:hypothetical protein
VIDAKEDKTLQGRKERSKPCDSLWGKAMETKEVNNQKLCDRSMTGSCP